MAGRLEENIVDGGAARVSRRVRQAPGITPADTLSC